MDYRAFAVVQAPSSTAKSRLRRIVISYQSVGVLVAGIEATMIVAGSVCGPFVYAWFAGTDLWAFDMTLGAGLMSCLLYVSIARSSGLYGLPALLTPAEHFGRIAITCGAVFSALSVLLFLFKIGSGFSRGAMLGFAGVTLVLCCMTRAIVAGILESFLTRDGIVGRPAFLIGERGELDSLTASVLLRQFGLRDVGRVALDPSDEAHPHLNRSRIAEAIGLARASCAKEFIVAAKFDRQRDLSEIEEALRASPLPVRLVPNHVFRSVLARYSSSQDSAIHLIDLQRAPVGIAGQITKRLLDLSAASLSLIVLAPIFAAAACAIKLDTPGPVIFRQRRNGFDQRPFVIFKFRTMSVMEDGAAIVQACPGDRRITRVGRVLRRTSIDELPQLLNVIVGTMSLVGPRPHALAHDTEYRTIISDYSLRHHVKPGMTGWAQVHGLRGETADPQSMRRRVELDLWYIDNWSLLLDCQILLRTCFEVMKQGAV